MANVNNPNGLEPVVRNWQGGASQAEARQIASSYAFAIYKWDPVTELAGVLNGPASGITPGTTRYRGVCLAWVPASTGGFPPVIVNPTALYVCQEDGSGGANVVAAKMGYNCNLNVASVAGGGVTRDNSGVQLTGSTINTTATLDMKISQLYTDPTNAYGANGRLEVRFNKHLDNPEITVT